MGKIKDAWFQMRIHKDLLEWLDEYAKRHRTDRTRIVTEYLMMLQGIDEGRHSKDERHAASYD